MTGKIFVDSNVLVYCRDVAVPRKQRQASEWMRYLWQKRTGRLSIQVLNEFYVTVTRKLKPGLRQDEARQEVRDFFAWKPIHIDEATLLIAWSIQDQFGVSFWDSLIVASAEAQGCSFILSEDFKDGETIGPAKIVSPFHHSPEDLEESLQK